jgi:hypothetical protein
VVTSSSQFFRQIGSTIGVALFGTFLTSHLNARLGQIMPGVDVGKLQGMGAQAAAGGRFLLPEPIRVLISGAITDTFAMGLWLVGAALLVVLLIPQILMRDTAAAIATAHKPEVEPAEAA